MPRLHLPAFNLRVNNERVRKQIQKQKQNWQEKDTEININSHTFKKRKIKS